MAEQFKGATSELIKRARIAVALPCFNEAPALPLVISEWKRVLPDVDIFVFDNNSTDGSGAVARELGARVIPVARQGKGYVVRAIFAELGNRDAVIMADADGTYPASAVDILLTPILENQADMTVGSRVPDTTLGAMSPVRGLGNVLLRSAFWVLIGISGGDLLSGYRLFGPRFLKQVRLKSHGFEIETEIACKAIAGGFRVIEKDVVYLPRVAGTASKLRAFSDGLRILKMMCKMSLLLKPWRIGGAVVIFVTLMALITGSGVLWIAAGTALGAVMVQSRKTLSRQNLNSMNDLSS
ncbi:MAG: hypothetical protein RJA81_1591 [Planctomycetota bacterium]